MSMKSCKLKSNFTLTLGLIEQRKLPTVEEWKKRKKGLKQKDKRKKKEVKIVVND